MLPLTEEDKRRAFQYRSYLYEKERQRLSELSLTTLMKGYTENCVSWQLSMRVHDREHDLYLRQTSMKFWRRITAMYRDEILRRVRGHE